jgi:hypothetical protein
MDTVALIQPNAYGIFWVHHDPDDVSDYYFDFSDWLKKKDDTVVGYTVEAENVTIDSHTRDSNTVAVFFSAGTNNTVGKVTVQIETAAGRFKSQTLNIRIMHK